MNPNLEDERPEPASALEAAAILARDPRLVVRVVLGRLNTGGPGAARRAAEEAGVDVTLEEGQGGPIAHFVSRHGDRAVRARDLRTLVPLSALEASPSESHEPAATPSPPRAPALPPLPPRRDGIAADVDVETYRWTVRALRLDRQDAPTRGIARRLRRASPRAHVCGENPALAVDDIGGLVRELKARADRYGVPLKVNPADCVCRHD